jgi:hypothetical protein
MDKVVRYADVMEYPVCHEPFGFEPGGDRPYMVTLEPSG